MEISVWVSDKAAKYKMAPKRYFTDRLSVKVSSTPPQLNGIYFYTAIMYLIKGFGPFRGFFRGLMGHLRIVCAERLRLDCFFTILWFF